MSCLIVGCGLSGVVIAERIANKLNKKVTIIEKRNHIGGNCYDYVEENTGILMNKYGAHLFHTNNEEVWNYINKFDKWVRWEHKVLTYVEDKFVPIPVNITTINELCGEHLQNEKDVNEWLEKTQIKYDKINNSEEMAKSRIGDVLYEKLIKDYTFKQWSKYPNELDKSVLERIPIRANFDTRYFNDKYQALPHKGYTHFFSNILDNKNIEVLLNTDYFEHIKTHNYDMVIFTGPIDSYFPNLEKLEYRSIDFTIEIKENMNFFQPNSVVNYPNKDVSYTRIVEYKHFLNQKSEDTVVVYENTNDFGEPFYPVPNKKNLDLYEKYKTLAKDEESKNVFFVGRLANYKYFNMDEAIHNGLDFFNKVIIEKYSELEE
uniref:UDP-galactopyranose mutase C-terminal domain-containing protein n=1 Tax=viral metagenome TaxID=1070528 RepID=A0A6C0I488_9ZZZZ